MSLANATLGGPPHEQVRALRPRRPRAGVSRMTADTVVSTAFSMIGEALARDETVAIVGF